MVGRQVSPWQKSASNGESSPNPRQAESYLWKPTMEVDLDTVQDDKGSHKEAHSDGRANSNISSPKRVNEASFQDESMFPKVKKSGKIKGKVAALKHPSGVVQKTKQKKNKKL